MKGLVLGAVVGVVAAAGPLLAQEGRLDLSGSWRVSRTDARAGTVSFSGRSPAAGADRYRLRFERPGAAARELAVVFDGRTLRVAPEPASLPATAPSIGASRAVEEALSAGSARVDPGAGAAGDRAAPAGSWALQEVRGDGSRPGSHVFRGAAPEGFPGAFGRTALELSIDGGEDGRLGVGVEAAFEGAVHPPVAGTFAWSATPPDALELQADGKWLVARGKRGGKVTLELSFTSKALGDVIRTSRVVEVRPGVEQIEVRAISYLTDHGLLRDNGSDWSGRGALIGEPEWTAAKQHPISHTMGQKVGVRLELLLGPADAVPGGKAKLVGDGPGDLDFEGELELKPGKAVVELTSRGALERAVKQLELAVTWSVEASPAKVAPERTATTVFVTYDRPEAAGNLFEQGITVKRMAKAIESVSLAASLDPHAIVKTVISKWDHFNLDVAYRNSWELGEERKHPGTGRLLGADCQTIVRYTRTLIKQVGVPGQPDFVVVWARCTAPKDGIESLNAVNHMGRPEQLHNDLFPFDAARAGWAAYLIDGNGRPNNYEAALRFSHDGKQKYYPGGVNSVLDSPTQVVGVFTTMSWVDRAGTVKDVIHRYR